MITLDCGAIAAALRCEIIGKTTSVRRGESNRPNGSCLLRDGSEAAIAERGEIDKADAGG